MTEPPRSSSIKYKALFIALALVHVMVLSAGVFYLMTDPDEGGLLVLIREIMGGRIPVIDINAHNQPLLYYLYGAWMYVFGYGIEVARSFSAVAVFTTGVLLAVWVYRFTESRQAAAACYLLFIADITFFKANIPVKPFAFSNLLICASFVLLTLSYMKKGSLGAKTLFAAGLLLGVSMGVRLIFLLPVVSVIWLAYISFRDGGGIKEAFKRTVFFSIGVLIPLLPSVYIFIKEPSRAYTIWAGAYMQVYVGKGGNPDFMTGVLEHAMAQLMLRGPIDVIKVPDMAVLFLLCAVSLFLFFFLKGKDRVRTDVYIYAWAMLATIVYVYSNVFLNYMGYINQLVIFLIILSSPLMKFIFSGKAGGRFVYYALMVPVLLSAIFFTHFQKKFVKLKERVSSPERVLTPGFVKEVSDEVAKITREGDRVFDDTGLFVFASGRKPINGFEYPTDAALFWNFMTDKGKAMDYLYLPEPELFRMIENKGIPVIILSEDLELVDISDEELKRSHISRDLKKKVVGYYAVAKEFSVGSTYTRHGNLKISIYKPIASGSADN